jgi:hypothetical protein
VTWFSKRTWWCNKQTVNPPWFIPKQYLTVQLLAHRKNESPLQRSTVVAAFPQRRPGFKSGSRHVGYCDGQKWRWGRFSPRTSVFPANLHSICISTIIFTITRGWHNRPGVAEVPIASQTRIKEKAYIIHFRLSSCMWNPVLDIKKRT